MTLGPDPAYEPGSCPHPACSDWKYRRYFHDSVSVVGFRKPGEQTGQLVVYIEGDGNAWRRRSEISDDPTPQDPVGLRLALRDPAAGVLYLARPCQFLGKESVDDCPSSLWTTARYSLEVVAAIDHAITAAKVSPGNRIGLVGFSGGGVIATLLAARRPDVDALVTVASPLDTVAWTDHHRVSALELSLNPLESEPPSAQARVIHFHGGRDQTVPPKVIEPVPLAAMERKRSVCHGSGVYPPMLLGARLAGTLVEDQGAAEPSLKWASRWTCDHVPVQRVRKCPGSQTPRESVPPRRSGGTDVAVDSGPRGPRFMTRGGSGGWPSPSHRTLTSCADSSSPGVPLILFSVSPRPQYTCSNSGCALT